MKNNKKLYILTSVIIVVLLIWYLGLQNRSKTNKTSENIIPYNYNISLMNGKIRYNGNKLREIEESQVDSKFEDLTLTEIYLLEISPNGRHIYGQGCITEDDCTEKFAINTQEYTIQAVQDCPKWGCTRNIGWSEDSSYILFETLVEDRIALTLYNFERSPVKGKTWWLDNESIGFDKLCIIPIDKATYELEEEFVTINASECIDGEPYLESSNNLLDKDLIPYSRSIPFNEFLDH